MTLAHPSSTPPAPPRMRRADRRLVRLLLLASTLYFIFASLFALSLVLNFATSQLLLWVVALLLVLAIPASGVVRAYPHRPQRRQFNADALFCMAWPLITVSASQISGFWNVPHPAFRFLVSALVAAAPLLLFALTISNHGMASRRGWRRTTHSRA
jgi:hypothetical protein